MALDHVSVVVSVGVVNRLKGEGLMMGKTRRNAWSSCGAYVGSSIAAVVITKMTLSESVFPYPVIVTWVHLAIQLAAMHGIAKFGKV